MAKLEPLGDVPEGDYDPSTLRLLIQQLERNLERLNGPFSDKTYTIIGLTERRTLDCQNATLQELCEVVQTILFDQWRHGRLRLSIVYAASASFSGTSSFTAVSNMKAGHASFSGTGGFEAMASVPFLGARVGLTANITPIDLTSLANVDWDDEASPNYDTLGMHEGVTNPERLTIPATLDGYMVTAVASIRTSQGGGKSSQIRVRRLNSSDVLQEETYGDQSYDSFGFPGHQCVLGPTQVSTGDYFISQIAIEDASSGTIQADGSYFWVWSLGRP